MRLPVAAAALLSLCGVLMIGGEAAAGPPAEADRRLAPASDREAMRQAKAAVPWGRLAPTDRQRVERVLDNASLYRRLPTQVAPCQPEVFDFLVRRPEVVTGIWNLMGISPLSMVREPEDPQDGHLRPGGGRGGVFTVKDNVGGSGRIELLHSSRDAAARGVTLAYVEGVYHQKPMPRPIRANCVLLLRSGSTIESNGQPYVTARLDAFVKFERVAADLVARGLQPLLAPTADHNFVETMKFVSTFSRTAETNPAGMRRLAGKLAGVDATVSQEMVAVCDRASHAASLRTAAREADRARIAQLRSGVGGAN